MNNLVILGIVGKNLVFLVAFVVDGLLSLLEIVFLFLGDLFRLLVGLDFDAKQPGAPRPLRSLTIGFKASSTLLLVSSSTSFTSLWSELRTTI